MPEIKTLASKEIYRNKWMSLREDKILRANGTEGIYSVVEKPDFVIILPVEAGHVYLVEQFRYPIQTRTLELPQGTWESEPQADPLLLAAGELREETGLVAQNMTWVGYQKLAQGLATQGYHIYLATGLTQHSQQLDPEEQGLNARKMSITEFEAMIANGDITDASTVTAFLLAKLKGLLG